VVISLVVQAMGVFGGEREGVKQWWERSSGGREGVKQWWERSSGGRE
jgi:hypothetical protein